MESVKICHFKTFRVGNSASRTFCCFFLHYIRVKKFVLRKYFSGICQYEFKSVKFKGVIDRPKNTDAPTFTSRYIDLYIRDGICQVCRFKTFWVRIFARGTLLLFRCFHIHVKMCVLLRYRARK